MGTPLAAATIAFGLFYPHNRILSTHRSGGRHEFFLVGDDPNYRCTDDFPEYFREHLQKKYPQIRIGWHPDGFFIYLANSKYGTAGDNYGGRGICNFDPQVLLKLSQQHRTSFLRELTTLLSSLKWEDDNAWSQDGVVESTKWLLMAECYGPS